MTVYVLTVYVLTKYLLYMETNSISPVIWEENDSTEQSTKFGNKLTFVPSGGINETKPASVWNVCKNIGNKKTWTRVCPSCNKVQVFKNEIQLNLSLSRNRGCSSCTQKKNHIGDKFGKLTIVNQYYSKNKRQSELKVDYVCECGSKTLNKAYQKVKNQIMCKKCRNTNFYKVNLQTSFNTLFNDYVQNAVRRKLLFTLTKDNFRTLTKENCFYCGSSPSNVKRPNATSGEYVYNGIDRKNNNEGYVFENCVPCCKICNFAKHKLSSEEFFDHIVKIYNHSRLNKR